MKCLSSIVTVTALLISSFTFTHAATNRIGGGTITFIGYVYEPQCAVKVSSSEQIDLECFRNGKNITKTSSLKNAKKLSSDFVKVEYNQFNNKPTLNVTYD
ncbi:TPA: hypothetical protein ACHWKL_000851 [Providencia stuartii]|uniref:Type 1 fimbrial protein n=3 Tax=Providencia stuartii TaxID=588 RepID=A0AAJ1JE17_PROST|nr:MULTISPECIES: hypothetical protein [Providencia]SST03516.1 Uncharacterised protein [Acinetobacter baumannii]AFH93266.1 hypothetical protein S70_06975 [Providencia stuartii MRSN 2154]AIN62315.1 putative periplasmic protein [Providencia stuartii]AMG68349.1 hypothetical protein AL507_17940 [Providencia stuartii]AVE41022.1 hypothetical protein AM353_03770 [Providencia stuartii]